MSKVLGIDWEGFIYVGGQWKLSMCARSGNMSIDTETIETTVTGSGNYRTFEPTAHTFGVSLDCISALNEPSGITLPELQALQLAKTKTLWRFTQTSIDGDIYTKEAYFYIVNSTDTGSFDGIATFSITLKGTGSITQIFTPPSPITAEVFRYPAAGSTAPATTGAYTWTATGLANKVILSVHRDGRGSSDIITSGTPVGNEVLYANNGSDGDFTWPFPFEDGETPPYVLYQNQ